MKKKLIVLLMVLATVFMIGGLSACSDKQPDDTPVMYTVTFDSMGGTAIPEQGVLSGNKVTEPGSPTKYGYDFVAWYKDENCTQKWIFETDTVSGNLTLYALWQVKDATADTYFDYEVQEDGSFAISLKVGQTSPADLILPSEHDGKSVTAIAANAFEGQESVKSVLIPDTIKLIGARAFRNCGSLEQILEAVNVETIGANAFYGTSWDSNLTGGVIYLGKTAYKYAGGMYTDTEVEIKSGTVGIASGAFQDLEKLVSIRLPEGLKTIGTYAFGGVEKGTGISEIVIPESVETIEDNAFRNCSSLTDVTIGTGVQNIGASAFAGTAITKLTYNANAEVRDNAFAESTAASEIIFGDAVKTIPVTVVQNFKGLTSVTLGAAITAIPDSAFDGLSSLATVTCKGTLTSIGSLSFRGTAITSFEIGKEVTSVGGGAFSNCTQLASVIYNAENAAGTTNLALPFAGCTALKTVTIGDSVKSVPAYLFKDVPVETLTLGANIETIGAEAFSGGAYASVTVGEKVTTIGDGAFGNNETLATVTYNAIDATHTASEAMFKNASTITIGEKVETIPAYFVNGNTAVKEVSFTAVIEIGEHAFDGCTSLATISGVDKVLNIGADAFKGTPWLDTYLQTDGVVYLGTILYAYNGTMPENYTLTVRDGTTSIAGGVFKGQTNLVSVSFPTSLEEIGSEAFSGCTGLAGQLDLSGVKTIGDSAFYGCKEVTGLKFGNNLESIGELAFQNCSLLAGDLVFPATMKSLGTKAFYNCKAITGIEVKGGLTEIAASTFYSATSALTSVKFSASVERLGSSWANLKNVTTFEAPGVKYVDNYGLRDLKVEYSVENVIEFGNGALLGFGASEVVIGENCTTIGTRLFTLKDIQNKLTTTDSLTKFTVKSKHITVIPEGMFEGCANLTSVSFAAPITEIGNYAFCNSGITAFDFSGVTKIGDYAFDGAKLAGELSFGNTLTSVGQYAFQKNADLTKVTIPGSLKDINNNVFTDCKGLTEVILSEGVTTVGKAVFKGCSSAEVTLPSTLTNVEAASFINVKALIVNQYLPVSGLSLSPTGDYGNNTVSTSVLIICASTEVRDLYRADTSVWKTAAEAGSEGSWETTWKDRFVTNDNFYGENKEWAIADDGTYLKYMGSKTQITIPKELKTLPDIDVLVGNTEDALRAARFTVAEGNTSFKIKDGVLMSADETIVYAYMFDTAVTSFSSETVTEVKGYAFGFASSLTSINLPNLQTIGSYAFSQTGLTSVTLENVTTIGSYAFNKCASLHTVVIGANCTSIGSQAFAKGDTTMEITVKATTPPQASTNIFGTRTAFAGKIYVPADSVETYQAASRWSTYKDKISAIVEA